MAPVYRVMIHPCEDTGGYWAECAMENGGCTAQGETLQETQRDMLDAIAFHLEDTPGISNYFLQFEICDA